MTQSGITEDKTATPAFSVTNNVLVDTLGLNTDTGDTQAPVEIHTTYAWGEKGKVQAGGGGHDTELVLKPATQYAVLFTAIGGSNKAHVALDWYEHTDSN